MTCRDNPRRVVILGLGLFGGGVGAARYFAERGATVVVSESRPESALAESIAELADLKIEYHFGGHAPGHFAGADAVIVNPAVAPGSPGLAMAEQSGAKLDTEINLLFRFCPAPIVAITGSNGKSTTVALLGEMLRQTGKRIWVGGNLGGSLLPSADQMRADDLLCLEISSFQAERLAWEKRGPSVGAVLNVTPNHLDRHPDMDDYSAAKRQLLQYQKPGDAAILNWDDERLREWNDAGPGRKFFVGAPDEATRGVRLTRQDRALLWDEFRREEISLAGLTLRGQHNRFNASCAALAAWLMGADRAQIEKGVSLFRGLPDRLELVAEKNGVRFYNDSIATTPESTLVALDAFEEPIVLIAGGSSKNLNYAEVGRKMRNHAKAIVLMGATADAIEQAVRQAGNPPPIQRARDLGDAVRRAHALAADGDVVVLSPASASFDMFRNYAERGRMFAAFASAL